MPQPYLSVVAEIEAKTGCEEEVRKILLSIVEPTRKEEGCIQYDLHVSTSEPGRFFFYENWTNGEALKRHAASDHIKALGAAVGPLVSGPTRVVICTKIA